MNTLKKLLLSTITASTIILSGCQGQQLRQPPATATVSTDITTAKDIIMETGIERGHDCVETKRSITCQITMDQFSSAFTQAMMVGSYGEAPKSFVKVSFIQKDGYTAIYGKQWMTIKSAYGAVQKTNNEMKQSELDKIAMLINNRTKGVE